MAVDAAQGEATEGSQYLVDRAFTVHGTAADITESLVESCGNRPRC